MNKKILLSGPSGSGKTSLALNISRVYNIPYINGSSKVLWENYGITCHKEVIDKTRNSMKWGINYQRDLLLHRLNLIRGFGDFVIDRSPLDNIVYFMLQNASHLTEETTKEFVDIVNMYYDNTNCIQFLLDIPSKEEYEKDGNRISNWYYQTLSYGIFNCLSTGKNWFDLENRSGVRFNKLPWDWEKRNKKVDDIICQK